MEQILTIIFFIVYIVYQVYKAGNSKKSKKSAPQGKRRQGKTGPSLEDILRELSGETKREEPSSAPVPASIPDRRETHQRPVAVPTYSQESAGPEPLDSIPPQNVGSPFTYANRLDQVGSLSEEFADHSSHIADRASDKSYKLKEKKQYLQVETDKKSMQKAIIYAAILKPKYF